MIIRESIVEDATSEWLEGLGFTVLRGPDISPDGDNPEGEDYDQVILEGRLKQAKATQTVLEQTELICEDWSDWAGW